MNSSTNLQEKLLTDIPNMPADDGGEYRARRAAVARERAREIERRNEDEAVLVKTGSGKPEVRIRGILI